MKDNHNYIEFINQKNKLPYQERCLCVDERSVFEYTEFERNTTSIKLTLGL